MTLTVTNAGARIVNISSLMAHPGKLKHLNLRLATLELKYIYKVQCKKLNTLIINLYLHHELFLKIQDLPTTHYRSGYRFPSLHQIITVGRTPFGLQCCLLNP